MEHPEVRYARSGDVNIAYGVVGEGPFDLVFVGGWIISVFDVAWEGPPREFFESLAAFCRLILFDKRGTGLSDRAVGLPDLETRMDDVRAVMDAAGSQRAALVGVSEGGPMTASFAATYPERTAALVLYGTTAANLASDGYPWARTPAEYDRFVIDRSERFGDPAYLDKMLAYFAPSWAGDEELARWGRRWFRASASPGTAGALARMNRELDIREVLPTIRVPTLVLHREDDGVFAADGARYVADRVPAAELELLPGRDHAWFVDPGQIVEPVQRFLAGIRERGEWDEVVHERVLATVLFTDIVGATARAVELGDREWRELLSEHHMRVRRQLARFRGVELDTAGDGFFARFDGPARAIRCASAIAESVRELGLDVRAGVHTGECEIVEGKVGGIAVHIGARVAAQAAPGEVLVSQTVKDLVAGSGLAFAERGAAQLEGVPGEWRLYAVA